MTDTYAEFANHLRFHVLRQSADRPVNEKLRTLLEEALTERNPLAGNLLEDMVYVVLNHPPPTLRGGQRNVVAAINWQNVHEQTKSYLKTARYPETTISEARGCEVLFLNLVEEDGSLQAAATALWAQKWNEYWSITEAGVVGMQRYTWNQLLLKEDSRPLPMGLTWEVDLECDSGSPYFRLTKDTSRQIGLACLGSPEATLRLLKLGARSIDDRDRHAGHCAKLQPLLDLCNKIDPRGAERRSLQSVAWKVFHLVRSYAVWGGAAFISIPVVIGTADMSHTAVLSVCSKRPLSPEKYRDWSFVANVLLRPLVEEDMFGLVREHKFAEAAYSIGHPFKHRFNDVTGGVRGLDSQVKELIREINVSDAEPKNSLLDRANRLLEASDYVWSSSETCRRVSDLLNFISSLHNADLSARIHEKYLVATPYWFADHLPSVTNCLQLPFKRYFDGEEKTVNIDAETVALLHGRRVGIVPFLMSWGTCRPFDSLYDELLYELLRNTAHYGFPNPCLLRISLDLGNLTDPALIFSNFCSKESLPNKVAPDQWVEWSSGREGGLRFFNDYLTMTGIGSIRCKFEDVNTQPRFSVRLALAGLTFNN
ncbi:MAG TPA: hypothetical protein VGW39_14885 [Chthoniobacterales bacterium]|nr:hypothetical protein [Chthoniobacterales bacterium]